MLEYNPFSLQDKTILVTGASSGIGKAIAIECSKMKAKVVFTARNKERLEETLSQMEGEGHSFIVADLAEEGGLNQIVELSPKLDGIVNCAGLTKVLPFKYASRNNFDAVMEINFYAPAELTRLLLRKELIKNKGSVIFISSISGVYCSSVASSIYSASKGAVNGLVKGMALDFASKGIRVNSINPGMINTNIYSEGIISDELLKEDMKKYPLKRYGEPEEVAYAAVYLLSDASCWVTGSNMLIDGGYTLC